MRLIDADARVTVQSFDIEHEEYEHTEMSVEEALDFATDEGCPPVVDAVPVVRCRDCKYYNITCCSPGFGWCERSGRDHGSMDDHYCSDGEMDVTKCCRTCRHRLDLRKWDYSHGGCVHEKITDGFVCLSCAHEGVAIWMVGTDEDTEFCECYERRGMKDGKQSH